MSDSFTLTTYVPASPLQVYTAWLDGEQHSEMTGGRAHCEPVVGAAFDAWDGYIRGTNLELEPGRRILQSWRSSEFPDDAPDSRVELTLQPDADGTTILLRHWDIPPGQGGNYEKGWHEHYFSPMRQFFEKQTNTHVISADKPAPTDWERPAGEEDVDDWSSESSEDSGEVGWEAPVIEEVDEPTPAPQGDEKPQPITLQAERPFLDAPQPKAAEKAAPKPKKAARKKPAAKKAPAKKKPAKKAGKKATKKKPAKKAGKKAAKKSAKKKPVKKAGKKKAGKKPAKKAAKKKAAKKAAKKKPAKKKAAAKRKPARKAAKKKAVKKPARKKR